MVNRELSAIDVLLFNTWHELATNEWEDAQQETPITHFLKN